MNSKIVIRLLSVCFLFCFTIDAELLAFPQHKISVAKSGTILVDGKPFFPIGSYYLPKSEHPYKELADAGFNLVQYSANQTELDRANKAGLMVWVPLGSYLDLSQNVEKNKENIRKAVKELKNNPALLAWESRDEPAWTWKNPSKPAVSLNGLVQGHLFLDGLDSNHPIWINHAPRNLVKTLIKFSRDADIISCDVYPIIPCGLKNMYAIQKDGYQGDLLNQTASAVGEYTKKMHRVAGENRSVWIVLQGFAWEDLRNPSEIDSSKILFPTYDQLRFMAYDAVINGANGILYWGTGFVPQPSRFWTDLTKVTKEISKISPVFLSTNLRNPLSLDYKELGYSMDDAVEMMIKKNNGKTFIIAANRSPHPAEVTFSGIKKLFQSKEGINVWNENRSLKIVGGKFDDWFEGYGVHVYTNAEN